VSQEVKRRTRVVRIFANREACLLRLITALAVEQSEEWLTGKRYLKMEELLGEREEVPEVKREEREVTLR
jgi:transposase-like protein